MSKVKIINRDMPYEKARYGSGALCKLENGDCKYLLDTEIAEYDIIEIEQMVIHVPETETFFEACEALRRSWIELKNAIKSQFKNFFCRNFYDGFSFSKNCFRRLSEFDAICDICNKKLNFSDYGYMCKKHGDIYQRTNWKFAPRFVFRIYTKMRRI